MKEYIVEVTYKSSVQFKTMANSKKEALEKTKKCREAPTVGYSDWEDYLWSTANIYEETE